MRTTPSQSPVPAPPSAWCVVANVRRDSHVEGRGGGDIEANCQGIKHFVAGAKLHLLRPSFNTGGERAIAIGRHRGGGGKRRIKILIAVKHLVDFRAKEVFDPFIVAAVLDSEGLPWDEASAREWAMFWTKPHIEEGP